MSQLISFPRRDKSVSSLVHADSRIPVMVDALGTATSKLSKYVSESRKTLIDNIRSIDAIIETIEDSGTRDLLRSQSTAIRSVLADL